MDRITDCSFFQRDVLEVAPDLLGKYIARKVGENTVERFRIVEVEAYRGEEDKACHASKGRTKRTEVMYHNGGKLYIYLIYGMYHMLNIVTGSEGSPQAVLIRGVDGFTGPGKLAKRMEIDSSFYGENLLNSQRIWLEEDVNQFKINHITTPRINIDYAQEWVHKPWRYVLTNK